MRSGGSATRRSSRKRPPSEGSARASGSGTRSTTSARTSPPRGTARSRGGGADGDDAAQGARSADRDHRQRAVRVLADANLVERLVVQRGVAVRPSTPPAPGFHRSGYPGLRDGVEQPFDSWLLQARARMFRELFEVLFVAYGYGHGRAARGLRAEVLHCIHIQASGRRGARQGRPVHRRASAGKGFQELWERVDKSFEIDTLRSATVHTVRRSPRGSRSTTPTAASGRPSGSTS